MGKLLPKKLDDLDVKILEALSSYGPRNITEIAKKVGISIEAVRLRIKRLSSLFWLGMSANIYHTYLGLKKAVVFFEAAPGYEDLLIEFLEIRGFCIYLTRCYGMYEGYVGIYIIPVGHETEFEEFLYEVKRLGLVRSIQTYWSTCFHTVGRTSKWFDFKSETWLFPWDEWIEEIKAKGTELPYTLIDPKEFPVKADEIDLLILKELEIDATTSLTTIAKKIGKKLQTVKYHYEKHCIGRGLIETFMIFIMPYEREISDLYFFLFKFASIEQLAKFALSLLDKPFVYIVGKIRGQNSIIAQIYLPKPEFRKFIDTLAKLIRMGLLEGYNYVVQDIREGTWFREELHPELFKHGIWIYDHKKHIKDLHDAVLRHCNTLNIEPEAF
jgi:DNA-binding Lrp family transcriptional regulator